MILRTLVRAVRRQWRLAAAAAVGTFLLGLVFVPAAFGKVRAQARIVLAGAWSAPEAAERVLADPVLQRALGGDADPGDLAALRSQLDVRIEDGTVVVARTTTRTSTAVRSVNAVAQAFESAAPELRREALDGALGRVDASIKDQAAALAALGPVQSTERLEKLQADIAGLEREIAALSFQIDQIAGRLERGEPGPTETIDTAGSERLAAELQAARANLEALRTTYPDDFPTVVRAAEAVEALHLKLAQTRNREVLQARFAPVRKAVDRLRELNARRDDLSLEISRKRAEEEAARRLQPAAADPETDSRRRTTTAALRDLEARRARLIAEKSLAVAPVARIEPAASAETLSSPLGLVFLGALLLGVVAARAAEALVGTIRTEDDLRRYVNLPVLGLLPRAPDPLLLRSGPRGAAVEPSLALGTLLARQADDAKLKVFAVTSARPGEGKSTVVANAAVALARAGRRVLVVDADLRRPTQHRIFSVAASPGLTEYVTGATDSADDGLVATEVEELRLMPAGAGLEAPLAYLASERFKALLADVKERFDLVLVDLPPVRRAADALAAAPAADGTILVLAAGETGKDDATAAKHLLRDAGAKLTGCVLTKAAIKSRGYEYYGPAVASP